jgi:hypothetical protein
MNNADLQRLLAALYDASRPLAELLPGASRAEVKEIAGYLQTAGLAGVRREEGVLVARISVAGRYFVEKARARG